MKLLRKILIANRGEIAMRITRAARELGIPVVAIYAKNDAHSPHVEVSDEAYFLGDGTLGSTYLNIPRIIEIALQAGCDAIHPGYGFLSENPDFIAACTAAGLIFIGPGEESVRLMGNKVEARLTVAGLGVPVLEGKTGLVEDILKQTKSLRYPILVKAAAGGGGKGMRIVRDPDALKEALEAASREALAYFGDATVYVEHYLDSPRHIEVQVFGDHHGQVVHLFERECSLQRRFQKIIEESPSPSLDDSARERITSSAISIANAMAYRNAGTIEFLVDTQMNHFFLEMNTRIQVEHPVTEKITGLDLVREQILVAAGNPLSFSQKDICIHGHAIESRIYAESPVQQFMPSPGFMTYYREPVNKYIRVDSGMGETLFVSPDYDPMIAKVISWGPDREVATARLRTALKHTIVQGIASNISFLTGLLGDKAFQENQISTRFCDDQLERLLALTQADHEVMGAAYLMWWLYVESSKGDVWDKIGYWRLNPRLNLFLDEMEMSIQIISRNGPHTIFRFNDSGERSLALTHVTDHQVWFSMDGMAFSAYVSANDQAEAWVSMDGLTVRIRRDDILVKEVDFKTLEGGRGKDPGRVTSPMPGKVTKVNVVQGDMVAKGEVLAIVEAMKMENAIHATMDGRVGAVHIAVGDKVDTTTMLLYLEMGSPREI